MNPLRVLLVEDVPADAEITLRELIAGHDEHLQVTEDEIGALRTAREC